MSNYSIFILSKLRLIIAWTWTVIPLFLFSFTTHCKLKYLLLTNIYLHLDNLYLNWMANHRYLVPKSCFVLFQLYFIFNCFPFCRRLLYLYFNFQEAHISLVLEYHSYLFLLLYHPLYT